MKAAQSHSPLLAAVISRCNLPLVSEANVDDVLAANPVTALFISGDWQRLAESDDVAAVLPEFLRLVPGLAIAVVARDAEHALQLRYRFNKFPALVFLRGAGYLGAILGMRDWSDYVAEIADVLGR